MPSQRCLDFFLLNVEAPETDETAWWATCQGRLPVAGALQRQRSLSDQFLFLSFVYAEAPAAIRLPGGFAVKAPCRGPRRPARRDTAKRRIYYYRFNTDWGIRKPEIAPCRLRHGAC